MQNILFKNKLIKKIFIYAFTHADEDYYVRELAEYVNEDPGNLSRALIGLEREGIYVSRTKGRLKVYVLNKEHPLFNELKNIVFKIYGIEGKLKELVSNFKGISFACIYGSYAKNNEGKMSDVDLLIVGTYNEARFVRDLKILEDEMKREINFNAYTEKEFEEEKKKKGGFLNIVLNDKIIVLKGDLNES